jgi:hypothetical protein
MSKIVWRGLAMATLPIALYACSWTYRALPLHGAVPACSGRSVLDFPDCVYLLRNVLVTRRDAGIQNWLMADYGVSAPPFLNTDNVTIWLNPQCGGDGAAASSYVSISSLYRQGELSTQIQVTPKSCGGWNPRTFFSVSCHGPRPKCDAWASTRNVESYAWYKGPDD